MANRVLPSREAIARRLEWLPIQYWFEPERQVLELYAFSRGLLYERNPQCATAEYGHHHTVSDHVDAGACFTVASPQKGV